MCKKSAKKNQKFKLKSRKHTHFKEETNQKKSLNTRENKTEEMLFQKQNGIFTACRHVQLNCVLITYWEHR